MITRNDGRDKKTAITEHLDNLATRFWSLVRDLNNQKDICLAIDIGPRERENLYTATSNT